MATYWKSILAATAGATVIAASAAHGGYDREDPMYGFSYDRYGNAYDRNGNLVEPAYLRRGYVPYVDPSVVQAEREQRAWERYAQDPRERAMRREYERAQRGDFDGVTPHPLSKHYSPG